jgi:hypothetical protein
MNTAEMEEEGDGLRRRIPAKSEEGTRRDRHGFLEHQKAMEGKLHQLFGMTREQAQKAVARTKEMNHN